jgi:hypothetical protein
MVLDILIMSSYYLKFHIFFDVRFSDIEIIKFAFHEKFS